MIKFRVGNNKNIKSLQCKLYPVPSHDIRNYASVLHTVHKYGFWFPEKCTIGKNIFCNECLYINMIIVQPAYSDRNTSLGNITFYWYTHKQGSTLLKFVLKICTHVYNGHNTEYYSM